MDIFVYVLLLLLGIVFIVKGGDFFVDAASWIAEVSGIPQILIGATIVSVATTLPELIVSIMATAAGSVEIAVGNAVGSVVANIGLIMSISLICLPSKIKRKDYMFKSILLVIAIVALWLTCMSGELNVWISLIVFAMFIVFVVENVRGAMDAIKHPITETSTGANVDMTNVAMDLSEGGEIAASDNNCDAENIEAKEESVKKDKRTIIINIIKFIAGAVGIVGGADLLVRYGQKLAAAAGIPEGIIAVTLVAIGTSLPELVTTITAVVKRKANLSVGNIIGANILDITMILPICAMVSGGSLIVPRQALILDIPFCLGLAIIGIVPMLIAKKSQRWQGVAMLCAYIAYLTLRVLYT